MFIFLILFCYNLGSLIDDARKSLFEDADPNSALKILSEIDTGDSHALQYFILKNFTDVSIKTSLCHLIASQDSSNTEYFSLMYSYNSYFTINLPSNESQRADLYYVLAGKIYRNYAKNKYAYRTKRLLKDLETQQILETTIDNILNLILAGDKKAAAFFLVTIESGRVEPAPYENLLKIMAQGGNPKAMGILGEMYLEGRGVDKCVETAMHYFTEGSHKKDPLCFTGMGVIYYREKKDAIQAKKYFEEASIRGSAEADFHLFIFYKEKYRAEDIGIGYLISSANKGYLPALYHYACKLYKQNNKKTSALYFAALCDFSDAILNGLLEAENFWIAGKWKQSLMKLMFCAEMGSTNAMYNILYILEKKKPHLKEPSRSSVFNNEFVNKLIFNYNKAVIDMGYKTNYVAMGNNYFYGIGCQQSYKKAFAFYLASSMTKDPEGLYSMSYLYEHGLGVEKDLNKSVSYVWKLGNLESKTYILVWYTMIKLCAKILAENIIRKEFIIVVTVVLVIIFCYFKSGQITKQKVE